MYNDGRDYSRFETYAGWPDHWFGVNKMTKHPQDRSQRLYINEKKKKRKQITKPKEENDEELVESSKRTIYD